METLLYRYLDRNLFDPAWVVMTERAPGLAQYDPSIPYVYTGLENRFGRLLGELSNADIVVFNGGFDPVVCQAAKISKVPALVEIISNTAPSQEHVEVDLSICVSETVKSVQPHPEKATVILNGVELERFTFEPGDGPAETVAILEAGRRDKPVRFHLDELADDLLPPDSRVELWLAGRGQVGQSTDRIRYLGIVDKIEQVYGQADILVMLSEKEALGLCAIEAMACGCVPVVAADTGLREVVTDGVNGFTVDATDRATVTATIQHAIEMVRTDSWEKMRHEARKTAEQKFDIRRCVRKYEQAFMEVVKKKGRRRDPGPTQGEPAPDVDLADAFFSLSTGDDRLVRQAVTRMEGRKEKLQHPKAISAARSLGEHFTANGAPDLALAVYSTLFRSGSTDPETIMMKTEAELGLGKVSDAVGTLKTGIKLNPDVADLPDLLDALESRLSRGQT